MKPFRFSLEKVLTLRRLQTMKAQQAVSVAQMAVGEASQALKGVRRDRAALAAELEQLLSERTLLGVLADSDQRHVELAKAEMGATRSLKAASDEMTAKRLELMEARRRELTLEKLRERHYEQSRHDAEMAEQAVNDEVARTMGQSRKQEVSF